MNLFNWFKKKAVPVLCNHEWEPAEIRQVRVENGRLVPFKIKTLELLECKKCKETKRIF